MLALAVMVVAVLGCSDSSPRDGGVPVTGSESAPPEPAAGGELSEPAEPDPSPATEPAEPDPSPATEPAGGEDQQLEAVAASATAATGTSSDTTPVVLPEAIASTAREDVPSALRDRDHPDHPEPLIDLSQIRSGGPPPDGIPPL